MNQTQPRHTGDNPQLNERLWQAWVCKNRELDRRGAVRRLRALKLLLGIVAVAAILQHSTTV
jgi:hypothetical protein